MKNIKIEIYEKVTKGEIDKNDMLRELLLLYGVRERYFFHHGEYHGYDYDNWRHTNLLIECTKDEYEKMKSDPDENYKYNPVMYMSNDIPKHERVDRILYIL